MYLLFCFRFNLLEQTGQVSFRDNTDVYKLLMTNGGFVLNTEKKSVFVVIFHCYIFRA